MARLQLICAMSCVTVIAAITRCKIKTSNEAWSVSFVRLKCTVTFNCCSSELVVFVIFQQFEIGPSYCDRYVTCVSCISTCTPNHFNFHFPVYMLNYCVHSATSSRWHLRNTRNDDSATWRHVATSVTTTCRQRVTWRRRGRRCGLAVCCRAWPTSRRRRRLRSAPSVSAPTATTRYTRTRSPAAQ